MKRHSITLIAALVLTACAPARDPAAIAAANEARTKASTGYVAQTAGLVAPVFQACADYAGTDADPKAKLIKAGFAPTKEMFAANAYQSTLQDGSRVKVIHGPAAGSNFQRGCKIQGTAPTRMAADLFYKLGQTSVQSAGYVRQKPKSNWFNKGDAEITVDGTLVNTSFAITISNSSSIYRK